MMFGMFVGILIGAVMALPVIGLIHLHDRRSQENVVEKQRDEWAEVWGEIWDRWVNHLLLGGILAFFGFFQLALLSEHPEMAQEVESTAVLGVVNVYKALGVMIGMYVFMPYFNVGLDHREKLAGKFALLIFVIAAVTLVIV